MKEFHMLLLLCGAVAAVLFDLRTGRIPNGITVTGFLCGLLYQIWENGPPGLLLGFGGALLPLLLFGGFYYFRMIGAGDVKLLCMAGAFLGPSGCFACITWSVFLGGLISAGILLRRRNFGRRLLYFSGYVAHYSGKKQWKPYLSGVGQDARFCFSVPILLGILCHIGGNI